MTIPSMELRRVMGSFATGVTIVTCQIGRRTHGITVNSLTSVSLNPPLILICIDQKALAHTLIPEAVIFGISVLAERQAEISDFFARRVGLDEVDELATVPWYPGRTGAPLIEGAIATLECRLVASHPGGDHAIFVAEVLEARVLSDLPPLLFFRGQYPSLA